MKKVLIACAFMSAMLPFSAEAYDWSIVAKVGSIEVTYMPNQLPFKIDTAGGTCPAGTLLQWTIHGANATEKAQNAQAVLSVLLSAQAAGRSITIYGNNSGCTVDYLYIN